VSTPEDLRISVVYCDPQRQFTREVQVEPGATVGDAIRLSGIRDSLPSGFEPAGIGIFGRLVQPSARLHDGDRVELYRPLKVDPKQARRKRADDQP